MMWDVLHVLLLLLLRRVKWGLQLREGARRMLRLRRRLAAVGDVKERRSPEYLLRLHGRGWRGGRRGGRKRSVVAHLGRVRRWRQ